MKNFMEKNKTLYFSFFLGATVLLVTFVAFIGFSITDPIIQANNEQRIKDNIAVLFSPEDGYVPNTELDSQAKYNVKNYDKITDVYEVLYEGELYAVIYNVWEQGKGGQLNMLVAVDPYTDTILGVSMYKHKETPKIGALYSEPDSTDKMIGQELLSAEVDHIAGATITWTALDVLYKTVQDHYEAEEVGING